MYAFLHKNFFSHPPYQPPISKDFFPLACVDIQKRIASKMHIFNIFFKKNSWPQKIPVLGSLP